MSSTLNFPNLDEAMARFENANPSYNNPGAVSYGDFAITHGAVAEAGNGLAIFPDRATGYAAQDALVTIKAGQGMSISDLINNWAPPNAPGNSKASTDNYVDSVTKSTGTTGDTKLSDIFSGAIKTATGAMPGGALLTAVSDFTLGGLPISRVVAILLGLILIGGGIVIFKPVSETVVSTGKAALTAAKVAAA